jgi:hypothetical protein
MYLLLTRLHLLPSFRTLNRTLNRTSWVLFHRLATTLFRIRIIRTCINTSRSRFKIILYYSHRTWRVFLIRIFIVPMRTVQIPCITAFCRTLNIRVIIFILRGWGKLSFQICNFLVRIVLHQYFWLIFRFLNWISSRFDLIFLFEALRCDFILHWSFTFILAFRIFFAALIIPCNLRDEVFFLWFLNFLDTQVLVSLLLRFLKLKVIQILLLFDFIFHFWMITDIAHF